MRMAFISYEYPPDTAFGGIGTYVFQATQMMKQRGHDVEVFSASVRTGSPTARMQNGVLVHRIPCLDRTQFSERIVDEFAKNHVTKPFDLIESGEYLADGLFIKRAFSHLPLVVKLHTPSFLLHQLSLTYDTAFKRLRFLLGGLLNWKKNRSYWKFQSQGDRERELVEMADVISSPSISLGDIISKSWEIDRSRIETIPYPYQPINALLDIPTGTKTNTVTYFGRLEIRKGVVDFAKSIPLVLRELESVKFRFIGQSKESPDNRMDMKSYLKSLIPEHLSRVEFIDNVSPDEIPLILAATDVCVIPSIWENFPNVCLEAMSAGRGIVATDIGGIKDMITNGYSGVLVPPLNSKELAAGIMNILRNDSLRIRMGENARSEVARKYNSNSIGSLMEKHYSDAIASNFKHS